MSVQSRTFEHLGERKTLNEWSRSTGISIAALYKRIQLGWSIEKMLTIPMRLKNDGLCRAKNCLNRPESKGYCSKHYCRLRRHGDASRSDRHFWANPVAKRLFHLAKARAKKHSIAFDLSPSDIQIPFLCPILGIPLRAGVGKFTDNSPSVDRIDTRQGYVKDNIQVISVLANRIKTDATPEQIITVGKYLMEKKGNDQ